MTDQATTNNKLFERKNKSSRMHKFGQLVLFGCFGGSRLDLYSGGGESGRTMLLYLHMVLQSVCSSSSHIKFDTKKYFQEEFSK